MLPRGKAMLISLKRIVIPVKPSKTETIPEIAISVYIFFGFLEQSRGPWNKKSHKREGWISVNLESKPRVSGFLSLAFEWCRAVAVQQTGVHVRHNGPVTLSGPGQNSWKEHEWHLLYLEMANNSPAWNSTTRFPSPLFQPAWRTPRELQRHKETGSQRGERQFAQRPCLPQTCLCFLQKPLWLSGESLTDSSLYASLLCDSYHTTESSVLRCSSPFYSEGWKYIFPHCGQTRVFHSLHVWRRNEYHLNEIHTKEFNPTK